MRWYFSVAACLLAAIGSAAKPPNVLLIFVDDMGYGDLGCYGATGWTTPRLDALAKEGARFTDFYTAQPTCSASRAALMTGCYSNRVGISGALGPNSKVGLHADETTLAQVFKSKGYLTGAAGKWHLGDHTQFLPTRRGFDSWLGLPYSNDMWPQHPTAKSGTYPPLPLMDGDKVIDANVGTTMQQGLTRLYTERAIQFIDNARGEPFFFYLAYSMPHVPLFADKEFRGNSKYGPYGDVVQEIDHRVGQLLDRLKQRGIADDTIVIFTSDNGPWIPYGNHAGRTGGLREGKGTVWEGGVREPCLIRWPGVIPAGSVCREPAMTIDLLPTLAKAIGAELPKLKIDGADITPLLKGTAGARTPHEAFAFYYHDNQLQAVRSGPWKLVLPHSYPSMKGKTPGRDGKPTPTAQGKVARAELYNLTDDVYETTDVSTEHGEVVQQMMKYVEAFREDLGDTTTKQSGKTRREPGRVLR